MEPFIAHTLIGDPLEWSFIPRDITRKLLSERGSVHPFDMNLMDWEFTVFFNARMKYTTAAREMFRWLERMFEDTPKTKNAWEMVKKSTIAEYKGNFVHFIGSGEFSMPPRERRKWK